MCEKWLVAFIVIILMQSSAKIIIKIFERLIV